MENINVEKLENNQIKLKFEIDSEKFEEAMNKSYFKNAKHFNIPGFRKGKAPRNIIERYYGENVLYEDAFGELADSVYMKAIKENNLNPVSEPQVDIEQIGTGKNLIFSAIIYIKPEAKIEDYEGIEISKKEYNVEDSDVDKEIELMLKRNSRLITVEDRDLQDKDIATIDFAGYLEEKLFEGGSAENYELEIGSGSFIPGFEEQLVGMKINEQREINVVFPEEYFSKELQGKPVTFKVTLHSIKAREFPKLDDEFAKDVSEFETLTELKENIKKNIQMQNDKKAQEEMNEELATKVIEKTVLEIPKPMVEKKIDELVEEYEWSLRYRGMTLEANLKQFNMDMKMLRESFEEHARKALILELALDKIAKDQNIEPTEEEIEERINNIAREGMYEEDKIEEIKERLKLLKLQEIKDKLKTENTFKWLYNKTKIL